MKKTINKVYLAFASVLAAIIFVVSCSPSDLTKDLNLTVGSDFLVNSFSVQIFDAADQNKIPDGATVTIEGRDQAKIFSLFGQKKISVVGGIIALATKRTDAPTATQTLEFTVVVSAPNYITRRKSYALKAIANQEIQSDEFSMVNMTALPTGASMASVSFNSAAGTGTAQAVAINSPLTGTKTEASNATIKVGTKMLAKDGSELTGAVSGGMIHFDSKTQSSYTALPGGMMPSNIKDVNGANLGAGVMIPATWYCMDMKVGDKVVDRFSQPMDVVSNVDPAMINPLTGTAIKAGDSLAVMSLSPGTENWVKESMAVVQNVGGKMQISYKQNHLSDWGIFFFMPRICTIPIRITSDLANPNASASCSVPGTSFYYEVFNPFAPWAVMNSGYSTFGNTTILATVQVMDIPGLNNLQVRVRKPDNTWYVSPAFNGCASSTLNVTGSLPQPASVAVSLNVAGVCRGNLNTTLVPSATLWYKEMGVANARWKTLVNIEGGKGCAKGLIVGKSYDFGIAMAPDEANKVEFLTMSKELKQPNGLKIPQGDTSIIVASPVWNYNHTFTIKKGVGSQYNLDYPSFALPQNICLEIDRKFGVFVGK